MSIDERGFLAIMAEECRNSRRAVQMTGTLPLGFRAVDHAAPFTEDALVENSIRNLTLEI